MSRLLIVSMVCCLLCLGCGKSGEDDAGGNGDAPGGNQAAVNQGQDARPGAAATTNTGAASGGATRGASAASSSNPVTNIFQRLDRAAKGGEAGRIR